MVALARDGEEELVQVSLPGFKPFNGRLFFAHFHVYLYLYLFLYLYLRQRPQRLVQAPLELLQVVLDVGGYADDDATKCELPPTGSWSLGPN